MVESVVGSEERASRTKQIQGEVKTKTLNKQEHLWELSRALAILASASVRSGSKFLFLPDCFYALINDSFV